MKKTLVTRERKIQCSTSLFLFFSSSFLPRRTLMYVSLRTTLNVPIPGYFTSYHISVDSIQDAGKYMQSQFIQQ